MVEKSNKKAVFRFKVIPEDLAKAKSKAILRIFEEALRRQKYAESSNGRTLDLESNCVGSSPTSAAKGVVNVEST